MNGEPQEGEEGQEGQDSAAKSFLAGLGDFKGIKTFRGRPSIYAIIAEKDGLALAITPKIALGMVTGVDLTVRVQQTEEFGNLENGGNVFGFPEVERAGHRHARTQMFVVVAAGPTTPYTVGKAVRENKIVEAMVDALSERVTNAGASLSVPKEVVVEYIRSAFEDSLPTTEPKEVITTYPILIGTDAINARVNEVYKAMQPPQDPGPLTTAPGKQPENDGDEVA